MFGLVSKRRKTGSPFTLHREYNAPGMNLGGSPFMIGQTTPLDKIPGTPAMDYRLPITTIQDLFFTVGVQALSGIPSKQSLANGTWAILDGASDITALENTNYGDSE